LNQSVQSRALIRAAHILGGVDALERFLDVTPTRLGMWMNDRVPVPSDVFMRVVDLLLDYDHGHLSDESNSERSSGAAS
jgi:hypothetical protein